MFTEKHYLEDISPEQLDAYLAKGWYRMGQAMFTCRFLMFNYHLYPTIWIRLPLQDYTFRKSARKLFRRNARQFRVEMNKATLTPEKNEVYQKYRRLFNGNIAPNLQISLMDDADYNIFNTLEFCVYDEDKLVAFSFFDIGKESAASILGVYDPDYHKYSLGYFTMLLEIDYCLQHNMLFYYPGYVVPGYERFDYKLRIGDVDYYVERTNTWKPFNELAQEEIPTRLIHQQLENLRQQLATQNISSQVYLYPPYEANLIGYWILEYLEYPLILQIDQEQTGQVRLIATYDHLRCKFLLMTCYVYDDLSDYFPFFYKTRPDLLPIEFDLLIKEEVLEECNTIDRAARELKEAYQLLRTQPPRQP